MISVPTDTVYGECAKINSEKACPLLDGMIEGEVAFGQASTIVDCTTDEISILRYDPISLGQIKSVISLK